MAKPPLHQVEKLFHEALALQPEERAGFLNAACSSDADLRAAVEALLQFAGDDEATDEFLESPLTPLIEQLRPELQTVRQAPGETARSAVQDRPAVPGYEVLQELGRGGMGVVYQARQSSLNRLVALKMLLPGGAAVPELLARFRAEAGVLARLQHPNIITIFDIGEHQGRPYFTMEYVAGPSLARLVGGRPQEPGASAQLLETLARTMAAVHGQGIVHRDLKPANILLQNKSEIRNPKSEIAPSDFGFRTSDFESRIADFEPKVTDFGLARDQTTGGRLTQTNLTMGTPAYMAPEQAGRGPVGPAADVYALGSILYEMLTGRPPFQGGTAAETLDELRNAEPVSPAQLRPRLPRDLETICLKCLEKAPAGRYGSALDLADDLRRFQSGEPIRARPLGPLGRAMRWGRRRPLVAGLLMLSALLAVSLVVTILVYNAQLAEALARAESKTETQRQHIVQLDISIGVAALQDGDSFTALLRFTEALRLDEGDPEHELEDRRHIAIALGKGPRLLELRSIPGRILCTRPHANGGWLAAIHAGHQVQLHDVLTGRSLGSPLAPNHVPHAGALSPNGRSLATIAPHGAAQLWDLPTGKSQDLPGTAGLSLRQIVFHPDGRVLLAELGDGGVLRWDLAMGPPALLEPLAAAEARHAAVSDDGRWLFTLDRGDEGRIWNVATGEVLAGPIKLGFAVRLAAISDDGRRLALLNRNGLVQIWDVALGIRIGSAFRPGLVITRVRFSPDSRLILTTNAAGLVRVWSTETGQALTPPLRHGGLRPLAAFHADGKRLAILSQTGVLTVWRLPQEEEGPALEATARPVADLVHIAEVYAASRIDEAEQVQPLEPGLLAAIWEKLRQRK